MYTWGDNQLVALTKIKTKNELIGEVIGLLQSPAKRVIAALLHNSEKKNAPAPEVKAEAAVEAPARAAPAAVAEEKPAAPVEAAKPAEDAEVKPADDAEVKPTE
ncbi:MAG: hypothetical protein WDN26_09195 [Chitinophagaceae bacterium]